jgi:hypothetical protein
VTVQIDEDRRLFHCISRRIKVSAQGIIGIGLIVGRCEVGRTQVDKRHPAALQLPVAVDQVVVGVGQ